MTGPDLRVRLMGGFEVEVDGHVIPAAAWRRRSAADLVKLLALAPKHRLGREQIAEALWPSLAPERALANVRKAAHHARKALDVESAVVTAEGFVELAPDGSVDADATRFEIAGRKAIDDADREACGRAAASYPGDLLPEDRYADWCSRDRTRLRLLFLDVLARGEQWGRLVDEDPTSERAHREIMRAQLARGDRRAALRQFEMLRSALRDIGVTPDEATIGVYEKALAVDVREAPTPAERARTLLAWGIVHWERADLEEAERAGLEVRALAIDAGLGHEFAEADGLLAAVAVAQGSWREFFGRSFTEALEQHPDLAPFVFDAHMCVSEFSLQERNGIRGARELARRLLEAAERSQSILGRSLGLLMDGEAALLSGEIDEARQRLVECSTLMEDAGPSSSHVVVLERLAELEDLSGNRNTAGMLRRQALELSRPHPLAPHLVPFVFGGMLAGAASSRSLGILSEAEREMAGLEVCEPCSMRFRMAAVAALASAGDIAGASRHLAEAEQIASRWPSGPMHAAIDEGRALMLQARGSREDVAALLERARDEYAASGRVVDARRCVDLLAARR